MKAWQYNTAWRSVTRVVRALILAVGAIGTTACASNGFHRSNADGSVSTFLPRSSATAASAYQVLHQFHSIDGTYPVGSLIAVGDAVYGTASGGGVPTTAWTTPGAVFALNTLTDEFARVHSFKGPEGVQPRAGLAYYDKQLFGTTTRGGAYGAGTAFAMSLDGRSRLLHSFGGKGDGSSPGSALLIVNGILWGVTQRSGQSGLGTIYSLTLSGAEKVAYHFASSVAPSGTPVFWNGTFYGICDDDIAGWQLYAWSPRAGFRVLYASDGTATSPQPVNLSTDGASLYLVGSNAVFTIDPKTGKPTVVYWFVASNPTQLQDPSFGPTRVGGMLYGPTGLGGDGPCPYNSCGSLYGLNITSKTITFSRDFQGSLASPHDGSEASSPLLYHAGWLYGVTYRGGIDNVGTLYRIKAL